MEPGSSPDVLLNGSREVGTGGETVTQPTHKATAGKKVKQHLSRKRRMSRMRAVSILTSRLSRDFLLEIVKIKGGTPFIAFSHQLSAVRQKS